MWQHAPRKLISEVSRIILGLTSHAHMQHSSAFCTADCARRFGSCASRLVVVGTGGSTLEPQIGAAACFGAAGFGAAAGLGAGFAFVLLEASESESVAKGS